MRSRSPSLRRQAALWLMQTIVRGYPPAFRAEFEHEMLIDFTAQLEDPAEAGFANPWQVVWFTLADTLRSIVIENFSRRNMMVANQLSKSSMAAALLLVSWTVFWGWSVLAVFNRAVISPDRLILGEQFSALADMLVAGFAKFAPLAALLLILLPRLRFEAGPTGAGTLNMSMRVGGKGSLVLLGTSVIFCLAVLLVFGVLRHIL